MKTPTLLLLTGFTSLSLLAQDAPPNGGDPAGHRQPPPSKLVVALDIDHDKFISAAELENAAAALAALDTNSDGQLTKNEFCPPRPPGQAERKRRSAEPSSHRPPPPDPLVKALDTDHDHVISATELAAAKTSFATLDENGDGQLTRDEFAPHRRPHGANDTPDDGDSDNTAPATAIPAEVRINHDGPQTGGAGFRSVPPSGSGGTRSCNPVHTQVSRTCTMPRSGTRIQSGRLLSS